jgi:hypothetical protein
MEERMIKIAEYVDFPGGAPTRVFKMSQLAGFVKLLENDTVLLTIIGGGCNGIGFSKVLFDLNQEEIEQLVDAIDTGRVFSKQIDANPFSFSNYVSVFKVDNKYTLESFVRKDERAVGTAFELSKDDIDVLLTALTGKSRRSDIEIVQEALDD